MKGDKEGERGRKMVEEEGRKKRNRERKGEERRSGEVEKWRNTKQWEG